MVTEVSSNLLNIPLPKNTIMVAREDGRIYVIDFTEFPQLDDPTAIDWDISVSKLILSKIQQVRTRLLTLEEIEVENIVHTQQIPEGAAKDFQLTVFGTLDGKNEAMQIEPQLMIDEEGFVRSHCRITARNFAIQMRGTYNVNTISVVFHNNGRR